MRTFIAKHFKSGLKITFEYDISEVIKTITFEGDWNPDKVNKVLKNATITTKEMLEKIENQDLSTGWIFTELTNISFSAFYNRYPKKVGRREQTEKMYNKLSNVDKMEAILYISELIKLKNDGTAFPYPATYLNQKYWR